MTTSPADHRDKQRHGIHHATNISWKVIYSLMYSVRDKPVRAGVTEKVVAEAAGRGHLADSDGSRGYDSAAMDGHSSPRTRENVMP